MSRVASRAGGLAAFWLVASTAAGAQVSGSLDLSASDIRYDLFQSSTALALSPAVAFDRGWSSLAARGTLVRFQSGHRDLHGSVIGTTFSPAFGKFRLELGVDLGASRYLTLATFSHAFGAADLHYLTPHYGAWVGGTGGHTSFGNSDRGAGTAELGLWASIAGADFTLTGAHSSIGDTAYTDLEGAARVSRWGFELDGRLGARVGSQGGGHGVYGEAGLTYALTRILGVTLGAGRYPTDPTRGTIAGRYATVGLRVGLRAARRTDPYRDVLERYLPQPSADPPVSVAIDMGPVTDAGRVLRVLVDGAARVEVMGDFTDWQPLPLSALGSGTWVLVTAIPSGPHLVEVRVDGGAWMAPAGATKVKDEFGGEAGLIVVP